MQMPNGLRYPRVGGTRQRRFDGTNFKPRKLSENAATPTRRVHAVLGTGGWDDSLPETRYHRNSEKIISQTMTIGQNRKEGLTKREPCFG